MKNIALICLTFIVLPTQAELLSAKVGLEKIKTNVEIAKKNEVAYDKNLIYILANIDEIQKVQASTGTQKNAVADNLARNSAMLKKISQQEKELYALMASENKKLETEAKQIEQLESLMLQIKNNQSQRQQIIINYQKQLSTLQVNKNSWSNREAVLHKQKAQLDESVQTLKSLQETWLKNKNTHQTQASFWVHESEKQQKIFNKFQDLAEAR